MKTKVTISRIEKMFFYSILGWNPYVDTEHLEFDWNDLMQLCNKMNELGFSIFLGDTKGELHLIRIAPNSNFFDIFISKEKLDENYEILQKFVLFTDRENQIIITDEHQINAVYQGIIQFYRWYNKEVKKLFHTSI